jgi:hypothetical protein
LSAFASISESQQRLFFFRISPLESDLPYLSVSFLRQFFSGSQKQNFIAKAMPIGEARAQKEIVSDGKLLPR